MPLFALSCSPGSIEWSNGSDILRTALYTIDDEGSGSHMTILLSNGIFECAPPDFATAADQSEALLQLVTAACRENARHAILHLYLHDTAEWEGEFQSTPTEGVVTELAPRLSMGLYVGINEAVVEEEDGLSFTFTPTDVDMIALGEQSYVQLDSAKVHVAGSFSHAEAHVSGNFRAQSCGSETGLFDVIAQNAIINCP